MDLIPLWPKAILPTILAQNHAWYLNTFNDQLIIKFEPWFASFFAIEAFYQLPMTLWFLFALPKGMYTFHRPIRILPDSVIVADNPKLTVHMLVYGAVGLVTTTTCCAAIYTEKDMSQMEKNLVLSFYSPFAVICVSSPYLPISTLFANRGAPPVVVGYIMMDMTCRIRSKIAPTAAKSKKGV